MGQPLTTDREFKPGSTGWTVDDLNDPAIERLWEENHYEIVEGVLAEMPPAYFDGHGAMTRLMMMVQKHLDKKGIKAIGEARLISSWTTSDSPSRTRCCWWRTI
jgi:hypothetical protein